MNHLAFHLSAEKFDVYRQRLKDKGVRVCLVLNNDESETQVSVTVHPGVHFWSFYLQNRDGTTLKFYCWTKRFSIHRCAVCIEDGCLPAASHGSSALTMTDRVLTDAQIAALSLEQRNELVS